MIELARVSSSLMTNPNLVWFLSVLVSVIYFFIFYFGKPFDARKSYNYWIKAP